MIFKKKKVKKEEEENKSEASKAEYKVVLVEKLGGTVREIRTLFAERFRDDEDHVVYLRNNKSNFIEIFPQQINDFKNYTETEVHRLIDKNTKILQDERNADTENVNDKDIEYELLKLQAKRRSFKFDPNASYLSFDDKGRPTFYFLREGSTFYPFKWDTDTKTIFVPSDNRKKSANLALRNKETKYDGKKLIEGATILLLAIGFIMLASGGYFWYKTSQVNTQAFEAYDQSNIADAQRRSLEVANQCAQVANQVANAALGIVNDVEADLNKNQTIIQGIVPE